MFFTKPSWQSSMKIAGDAFTRWEMTGVTHNSTVFMVRSSQALRDDGDGYSYLIFGPQVLKAVLDGADGHSIQVYALEWDRLVAVDEFWSYAEGETSMTYFAYRDKGGRATACELLQPDPDQATNHTVVWQSAELAIRSLVEAP
ncbi:hypothetical protein [Paraburkholderia azotifigens]|uniref:Uncharacterized protein n=1 Tax=Paraburkholderia azotifigens TaxID=2057004 RepID=A0A5C6VB91_9BURK|nr:hypothetical protein [Paraburkholderia azotifigens]TXC82449.1 hypothetical protein FRZ40_18425 [Paraburkholderia azotifigens]